MSLNIQGPLKRIEKLEKAAAVKQVLRAEIETLSGGAITVVRTFQKQQQQH